MSPSLALVPLLAPGALLAVALAAGLAEGPRPRRLLRAARLAAYAALALAVASAVLLAQHGPATSPTLGAGGIGLSLRLDTLSTVMFLLVSAIGVVVVRYSASYLDGDSRQAAFVGRLLATLAAVLLLVLAGNLVQLVLAWIATSLALHRLLVFNPERPRARLAARKKFLTARLGDLCLLGAAVLLATGFGTLDLAELLQAARGLAGGLEGEAPAGIGWAALLIALAALLKSGQFPTHGWLPEVMETPTPVSALLHAGIVNAGGFLVVRFADVMLLSAPSLHLLALLGGFTALFGAAVMLTQTSVKVALAWSTVAQMGFMLLQCGLGLFALAVLHIVAHSLYKAHAFLAAGGAAETPRLESPGGAAGMPPARLAAALFLAVALSLGLGWSVGSGLEAWLGLPIEAAPQGLALAAILAMGLTLLFGQAARGARQAGDPLLPAPTLAAGALAASAYFLLHAAATALFGAELPAPPQPGPLGFAVLGLAVASFGAVTLLQLAAPARAGSPVWRAFHVHLSNGLYANAVFDRLVGALDRRPDRHPATRP